jgi:hypothetical protein
MAKNTDPKKIITGWDTRWSYCNVWEAKGIDGSKPAWSVNGRYDLCFFHCRFLLSYVLRLRQGLGECFSHPPYPRRGFQ